MLLVVWLLLWDRVATVHRYFSVSCLIIGFCAFVNLVLFISLLGSYPLVFIVGLLVAFMESTLFSVFCGLVS
jgi:F0F1-type ATP synthase assembly protein I|uniref:Transmembrane protein n=1 Tax=Arabidopsis thaliana TaxID=3702 RepID=Q0WWM6_ARATH|nr:hypothetical protein [Arabidopsis thaliana]